MGGSPPLPLLTFSPLHTNTLRLLTKTAAVIPPIPVCPFAIWTCCSSYQEETWIWAWPWELLWSTNKALQLVSLELKRSFSFHASPLGTLRQEAQASLLEYERPRGETSLADNQNQSPGMWGRWYWPPDSTKLTFDTRLNPEPTSWA